jgi:hypothetical protein
MARTDSPDGGPRPHVYARLAIEAEDRAQIATTPRWARPVGWGLVALIALVVVLAAAGVEILP